MKTAIFLAMAAAVGLAACAQPGERAEITSGDEPIPIPATDLQWVDLDPEGAPGVQTATLWGDLSSGPFGAFFRLPAGFAAPFHTHTHAMKVVIVSGTYIQEPAGESEFQLGPGSFLMQPGGDYRHITRCSADADCVFFVEGNGAFDLFVADAPSGATQ